MNRDHKHIDTYLLSRFLAGEANQDEQVHVKQWMGDSPENARLFNDFQKVWSAMDSTSVQQDIDIDTEWELHVKKYNPAVAKPSRTITLRTVIGMAASILVIMGFSYFGWQYFSQKSVQTDLAETSEIILPDGSKVTINAGSRLTYKKNFDGGERKVTLEGEAYFEVKKNPQSPFVINLGHAEVKVLGTSFNVKAYKDMENIEVAVSEGQVGLYEKGQELQKVIIGKGEMATYYKPLKTIQKQKNEDRNFIAWKTRSIVFENDSLATVVKTLQQTYRQEIILENQALRHCTITTTFENKSLPEILTILGKTLEISIEEKDGKIYIRGKGC